MTYNLTMKNPHYDESYFALQRDSGEYSADIDLFKFEDEIKETDRVVDFGCGGGFMLDRLCVAEKAGVEVNPVAAEVARSKGIRIFASLDHIENDWADVIISHHALEHVDDPLAVLRAMRRTLRQGGKIVIITPNESHKMQYRDNDPNFHLFTWSPSNLGNLLKRAGFENIVSKPLHHRWPPYSWLLRRLLGRTPMHCLCVFYGRLRTGIMQVKAVAEKP